MELIIRNDIFEYLACSQSMTGVFGHLRESASKIKYNMNLIM